jgi:hypothetical protein
VIELNGQHGPDSPVAGALGVIGELMQASSGDLLVVRRSSQALKPNPSVETRSARPEPTQRGVPAKWAA